MMHDATSSAMHKHNIRKLLHELLERIRFYIDYYISGMFMVFERKDRVMFYLLIFILTSRKLEDLFWSSQVLTSPHIVIMSCSLSFTNSSLSDSRLKILPRWHFEIVSINDREMTRAPDSAKLQGLP
jgi:hypothetical protein